jgi:hypothetical protein
MDGKSMNRLLAISWVAMGCVLCFTPMVVAAGNPLIGTWKPAESSCSTTSYVWTQTQQTINAIDVLTGKPWSSTIKVTFNTADPRKIYVIGNSGIALGFNVLDPGTIKLTTYPGCTYKRVK